MLEIVLKQIQPFTKLCLAYSGGLDSQVLLTLLIEARKQRPELTISAIHVNHQIHPEALQWARHCELFCLENQIELTVLNIDVPITTGNIEAKARQARYAAIENVLNDRVLLTAHHADDQIETLLLQLLRGAGIDGLSAMPQIKPFGDSFLLRPMLETKRETILSYAESHQLHWIEDPSNQQKNFQRNFLRHKILPKLKNQFPGLEKTWLRSIKHLQNTKMIIDQLVMKKFLCLENIDGSLSVDSLQSLEKILQAEVLRVWIRKLNLPLPSEAKIKNIQNELLTARIDANPIVTWPGAEIRRFRDKIYAMSPINQFDSRQFFLWNATTDLKIAKDLVLEKSKINFTFQGDLLVKFRQGGEKIKMKGELHHREVKTLFQTWRIPPWQRARIPLIYNQNKLIAIWGYAVAEVD